MFVYNTNSKAMNCQLHIINKYEPIVLYMFTCRARTGELLSAKLRGLSGADGRLDIYG